MSVLAFDIGGSSVKYGLWHNNELTHKNSFPLPSSWIDMKNEFVNVLDSLRQFDIIGVALSAPGIVNQRIGEINGVSAVSYIHDFPIVSELEQLFKCHVSIENDANCAALAEVWKGVAKEAEHCLFFVIGSGIGGAVVINKKLFKGKNLFGGEFGYMFLNDSASLSELGSSVKAVETYNRLTGQNVTGEELFKLAEEGNSLAIEITNRFFRAIAIGIYNLLVAFDPGLVILGGGVSENPLLLEKICAQLDQILLERGITEMDFEMKRCLFRNDANLVGAVYNYLQKERESISFNNNSFL